MRKIFSFCVALFATTALWAYDFKSGDLYYNITSSKDPYTVEVTREDDDQYNNLTIITIPNTVTNNDIVYNVTSMGWAFTGCTALTSITIGDGITKIEGCAFSGCTSLTSIILPENLISIDEYAFAGCANLSSIIFPENLISIDECAFMSCASLTSIVIPNNVTSMGAFAFSGCTNLSSVTIGDGVTDIGYYAFQECKNLTSITIGVSVTDIMWLFEGCVNISDVTWNARNCECSGKEPLFTESAAKITSFTFGDEVEMIPNHLCYGMQNISSVNVPKYVTNIGDSAFYGCTNITKVVWNARDCIYSGSGSPFAESADKITSFAFGNEVETIPSDLCNGFRRVRSVTLPRTLSEIGDNAFNGCNGLVDITIYASLPPLAETSSFSNYNATLHVPCDVLQDYRRDAIFGQFSDIQCICANEIEAINDVTVVAALNDAAFTWPQNAQAGSYTLVISKDGEVFCTLTFNGSGQLMGIAFAPSSDGTMPAQAAETTVSGYQFTVTGLDEASNYTYNLTVKDATGNVLHTYTGAFATDGATGLDNTAIADIYSENGRIVCAGEFTIYDLLGRDVTRMNGQLNGVYIVKSGDKAQKVIVR